MTEPAWVPPQRVHFITDSDCGYTLKQIRFVPGGGTLYGELHQRPTDERLHRALPAIAIVRTPEELPTVGLSFSPEILTDVSRGTAVLHTGRVEIVSEEPPSRLLSKQLQRDVDALLSGRIAPSDCVGLRESLETVVSAAAARIERRGEGGRACRPDWTCLVDEDLAGVPRQWIEDLATARQALAEISATRRPMATRAASG
jgi:hypothetical protein